MVRGDCPGLEGLDRLTPVEEGNLRNIKGTAVGEGEDPPWFDSASCCIDRRRLCPPGVATGDVVRLGGSDGRSPVLPTAVGDVGRLAGKGGKPCSIIFELIASLNVSSLDILLTVLPGSRVLVMSGGSVTSRRIPKKDNG